MADQIRRDKLQCRPPAGRPLLHSRSATRSSLPGLTRKSSSCCRRRTTSRCSAAGLRRERRASLSTVQLGVQVQAIGNHRCRCADAKAGQVQTLISRQGGGWWRGGRRGAWGARRPGCTRTQRHTARCRRSPSCSAAARLVTRASAHRNAAHTHAAILPMIPYQP